MLWRHAQGVLQFGDQPLLAGILNVTPDSFSDGGQYATVSAALRRAEEMLDAGAQIIDVGGESTRPGAAAVPVAEELRRVLPIISAMNRRWPLTVISVDTYKAEVARQAVAAGASVINDVGGGWWDERMLAAVADSGAGYIAMHSLDREMRRTVSGEVVATVSGFLRGLGEKLARRGIAPERVIYDPGAGFGKTPEQNLQLLRATGTWRALGRPLMWGVSRKRFLAVSNEPPQDRLAPALAVHGWLLTQGYPQIWRVHDVAACAGFIKMRGELEKKDFRFGPK
ncbi:MAG: dihydropteroate synthase [Verrucomicrobiales bacterium]|jgi:dihydropteroate synthase|nr:dihydropteroate synthase [Verrucomicrobiales bacterium]